MPLLRDITNRLTPSKRKTPPHKKSTQAAKPRSKKIRPVFKRRPVAENLMDLSPAMSVDQTQNTTESFDFFQKKLFKNVVSKNSLIDFSAAASFDGTPKASSPSPQTPPRSREKIFKKPKPVENFLDISAAPSLNLSSTDSLQGHAKIWSTRLRKKAREIDISGASSVASVTESFAVPFKHRRVEKNSLNLIDDISQGVSQDGSICESQVRPFANRKGVNVSYSISSVASLQGGDTPTEIRPFAKRKISGMGLLELTGASSDQDAQVESTSNTIRSFTSGSHDVSNSPPLEESNSLPLEESLRESSSQSSTTLRDQPSSPDAIVPDNVPHSWPTEETIHSFAIDHPQTPNTTVLCPPPDLSDWMKKIIEDAQKKVDIQSDYLRMRVVIPTDTKLPKSKNISRKPRVRVYKPAYWANKKLYDFLKKKLEPEHQLRYVIKSEEVVGVIYKTVQKVTHSKNYEKGAIDELKVDLAKLKVIETTNDFYRFVKEFLPADFADKVIPCLRPFTNIIWPPLDNMKKDDEPIIS